MKFNDAKNTKKINTPFVIKKILKKTSNIQENSSKQTEIKRNFKKNKCFELFTSLKTVCNHNYYTIKINFPETPNKYNITSIEAKILTFTSCLSKQILEARIYYNAQKNNNSLEKGLTKSGIPLSSLNKYYNSKIKEENLHYINFNPTNYFSFVVKNKLNTNTIAFKMFAFIANECKFPELLIKDLNKLFREKLNNITKQEGDIELKLNSNCSTNKKV